MAAPNSLSQHYKQENYTEYPQSNKNQILTQAFTNQDQDEVQIIGEIKGTRPKTTQIQCEVWHNDIYYGNIPSQSLPIHIKQTTIEHRPISPTLLQPEFQFWTPHFYTKRSNKTPKPIGRRRTRSESI
jgi:hypothetical protein